MLEPTPSLAAPKVGVRVTGARLTYGGIPVFEDLSAIFEAGSITCILGASGVGKSSLLRMIAGLGPETSAVGSDGAPLSGRIAYMDQRDFLLPWLSALENVLLGARLRREPKDLDRAWEMLEGVELSDSAHLLPAQLSGGMRQRVALARTLMEDQPVVLMDEPFSAVDALTRLRLQDLSARLLAKRTVVMVTHDPMEAARLGNRIHIMSGTPATLDEGVCPPGPAPRDSTSQALTEMHRELLAKLGVVHP
jgi:putative hydroxymethylpyrimidine transport system ATP-binding protein